MSRPTRHPLINRFSLSFLASGLLILFELVQLSGCSMYQNVTGYFNTYYNARRQFDEAADDVRQLGLKDRDTNCFVRYTVAKPTQDKFDKVIEKCSKLIQFYPKSKWVDDAILMIAESYVYLGEYESAGRKIKELLEHFPDSDLRFEAKLWDAKAKYFLNEHDAALAIIKDLFPEARSQGKNDVLLEALMLQARIFTERSEYDQAAASYALAVEVSGDDSKRSSSAYLLGLCYERTGEKAKAAQAYGNVRKFSPSPWLEFQSQLRYASMLGATGDHHRALKTLDEMNNDGLSVEQHGLIDLEIANTELAMGDSAKAFGRYAMVDTVYKHTEASARSYYRRGLVYEEQVGDYTSARAYYDKAKGESPTSEVAPLAARKADNLARYFASTDGVKKYQGLYVQALYQDSTIELGSFEKRLLAASRVDTSVSSGHGMRAPDSALAFKKPGSPDNAGKIYQPPDAIKEQLQAPREEMAHGGSETLRRRLSDRDLFPDDEEAATPTPKSQRTDSTALGGGTIPGVKKEIPAAPVAAAPAVPLQPDSIRAQLAGVYFELGGIFYLELNRPDSALACYRTVVEDFPKTTFVPRALYAMAEIQSARHDTAVVDSLYRLILTRYGESEYAAQVRKVLGIPVTQVQSTDTAEAQYHQALDLMQAGKPKEALNVFKLVAAGPRRSLLRPKAAYAVGWLYETAVLNNDSAAEWYRHLASDYPTSVYASQVKPKIVVYDNPENLKQLVRVKGVATPARGFDSLSLKQPPGLPPGREPAKTAIDRIKERQLEEMNQSDEVDSTKDEDEPPPDEDDQPDPDDNN